MLLHLAATLSAVDWLHNFLVSSSAVEMCTKKFSPLDCARDDKLELTSFKPLNCALGNKLELTRFRPLNCALGNKLELNRYKPLDCARGD